MKNRKKIFKCIICIILIISLVFVILPQVLLDWHNVSEAFINRMLVLYYSFSILGALGTCTAVLIALFSEEIKMWLYKPNINIHFKEEDGFIEKIDEFEQYPYADSYRCILEFEDVGFVNATSCSFKVIDVKYGKTKEKAKSVKNWMGTKSVTQIPFDISVDYPYELGIISINNPDAYGTPTDSHRLPMVTIHGVFLDNKYRGKGYWEIHYCLIIRNVTSIKFSVAMDWDGSFTSRKTEMKEHLKITIL